MKNLKLKKVYKKILFSVILVYFVYTLILQQQTLNTYQNDEELYAKKIEQEQETKATLLATKESVDSTQYIESVAREKLGMYLPNEKVYIDRGK